MANITNAPKLAGVIWDFDGTLVDSMPLHFEVWRSFMQQHKQIFSYADFLATAGKPAAQILQNYFPTHSAQELNQLAFEKDALYREQAASQGVVLLAGAARLLEDLAAAGFKQAIGSGTPPENLRQAYQQHPIFQKYIQAAVVAGDTENVKPHPEVFLTAAAKLGLAPANCLVIEDGLLGVEAARRAGMRCVAVVIAGQDPVEFLAAGATKIVSALTELDVPIIQELLTLG